MVGGEWQATKLLLCAGMAGTHLQEHVLRTAGDPEHVIDHLDVAQVGVAHIELGVPVCLEGMVGVFVDRHRVAGALHEKKASPGLVFVGRVIVQALASAQEQRDAGDRKGIFSQMDHDLVRKIRGLG